MNTKKDNLEKYVQAFLRDGYKQLSSKSLMPKSNTHYKNINNKPLYFGYTGSSCKCFSILRIIKTDGNAVDVAKAYQAVLSKYDATQVKNISNSLEYCAEANFLISEQYIQFLTDSFSCFLLL